MIRSSVFCPFRLYFGTAWSLVGLHVNIGLVLVIFGRR